MSCISKKQNAPSKGLSDLPNDVIFKIFVTLPSKDLVRLRSVCKTWYRLINSPNFIESHMSRCEPVLTFLRHDPKPRPNMFSINANNERFTLFEPSSSNKLDCEILLMDFNNGKYEVSNPNICGFSNILAACNGLILATNRSGTLLILNPATRKLVSIKPGTMVQPHDESYGFVFSHRAREYKIVHLLHDRSGHIDSEILSLKTMSWRGCTVPSFGSFRDFVHKPVVASGVVYWLPGFGGVDHIVSMDIDHEKFVRNALPVNSTGLADRLLENQGLLNFVGQMTVYRIQVWVLKTGQWVKRYTINMDYDITGMIPMFITRNGKSMIFKMLNDGVFEYDVEEDEMKEVFVDGNQTLLASSNVSTLVSLVSLENSAPLW